MAPSYSEEALLWLKLGSRVRLLHGRRLVVVLDLDHTLLHSRLLEQLSAAEKHRLSHLPHPADLFRVRLPHDSGDGAANSTYTMLTKLRPGVRRFLSAVSGFCDLYIYTHGDRHYAKAMADLLDPDGAAGYFAAGRRVFSREDCPVRGRKTLSVVPEDEALVVVLDDTVQVWDRHRANLVDVTPYNYFSSCFCKKSMAEVGEDEADVDGVLDRVLLLLFRLHQLVFGPGADVDSRKDVRRELAKIRSACCLPEVGPWDRRAILLVASEKALLVQSL